MTSEGLGEMFECNFADTCAKKKPLVEIFIYSKNWIFMKFGKVYAGNKNFKWIKMDCSNYPIK